MKALISAVFMMIITTSVSAGDAENIAACVKKAKEFSGVTLDDFDAVYKGNIFSMSTVKWNNALCEVKFGDVYKLIVNNEFLVYEGFSGENSYDLNETLRKKTENAIAIMNSRIELLKKRMDKVEHDLKKFKPDHDYLTRYIDEGIEKSVGISKLTPEQTSISPSTQREVDKSRPKTIGEPAVEGELIPRSMYEKANYYLISVKPEGKFVRTLSSRISTMSHGYSVTRIDCKNQRYQDLGYGEDQQSDIKMYDKVQWAELVPGSSKSDLVTFVCSQ